MLDGRWAAAEAFAAPEDDDAASHPSVDRDAVRARVRTQAFLELLDDASAVTATGAPDPDALVAALERLREVCGDDDDADDAARAAPRDRRAASFNPKPPSFRDACAVLALGDVRAHPPLRGWTKARGRLETFEALARELAPLYPAEDTTAGPTCRGAGALELALRRAVAHAAEDAARPAASLRSALGFELGDVRDEREDETVVADEEGEEEPSPLLFSAGTSRRPPRRPHDDETPVVMSTSTRLRHEDLMGAFANATATTETSPFERTETRDDAACIYARDDDDETRRSIGTESIATRSPRFALLGDVVEADAGVRCLTRFPHCSTGVDQDTSGIGAFVAATSSRVLHVAPDAGGARRASHKKKLSAHAGPCSVYAVTAVAADAAGGGVVATGANDGGLALTELRLGTGNEGEKNPTSVTFGGSNLVERRAVRGGAVRAAAFVGSAARVSGDASDEFARAADARIVVAAGGGDFTPRAWQMDESGLGFAGPGFELGAHAATVVAAAADPETRWLLFTASAAGEAFVWDLRESRARGRGAKPSLRVDVAGACGDGAAVTAATVRGGRFAFGFANGGIAAADERRGCNSVAFGSARASVVGDGVVRSAVVWSDLVHPGFECRSVDIAPRDGGGHGGSLAGSGVRTAFASPFLILSGGFDGRLALADAATGRVAWSAAAHADKVTAARFDARGTGFASCGVDRVVKAWALRARGDDAGTRA